MTETAPMITFTRPGTVLPGVPGHLLPGIKIKFVEGEIVVSGDNVMQGYYNKPEDTAQVLKDGWLSTGDLGYLDEKGYLHITGRKKEIIVLPNGKNINPEEVERVVLKNSEFVKEVGVFLKEGILQAIILPDFRKLNEAGITDLDDYFRWQVIDKINHIVSPYKKILRFHITSAELPKTRLGKIRRYLLPDLAGVKKKQSRMNLKPGNTRRSRNSLKMKRSKPCILLITLSSTWLWIHWDGSVLPRLLKLPLVWKFLKTAWQIFNPLQNWQNIFIIKRQDLILMGSAGRRS